MTGTGKQYTGTLTVEGGRAFLLGEKGEEHFSEAEIWNGYIKHWAGRRLRGTLLQERGYETGRRIVLLQPCTEPEPGPFVELYYNERLPVYFYSYLGHLAINVNGGIFNFSHLLNECEVMSEGEYFYRPALGKFAPKPGCGYNVDDPDRPYLDKFGRQFMRTIHVARITGIETERLSGLLHHELDVIHNTPEDPCKPGVYRDFGILTRSCSTIIRDSLKEGGFPEVKGVFPREIFINALWNFRKYERTGRLQLCVFHRPQLRVEEAPCSVTSPLFNPLNILRAQRLKREGIII